MTNKEILKMAIEQSAIDTGANASDFRKSKNVVVLSRMSQGARRYLKLLFSCQLVSYGNNVVASVSPKYRGQGIASALTPRLAVEILNRVKVPFYCAAWCNIKSVRNAIKSGFCLAWVELTAKSCKTVDEMNQINA